MRLLRPLGLATMILAASGESALPAQQDSDSGPHSIVTSADTNCPAPVRWPALPDSSQLRPAFRSAQLLIAGADTTWVDGPKLPPSVHVPQYAYFHRPRGGCEPVIVIQSEGETLGFSSLDGNSGGASRQRYFTLLGTDPPR